ncbi:Viral IAP-associated factor, partial [Operophtera brumata]
MDNGDLEAIRQQRINELKKRAQMKQDKSSNVVCHYYKSDSPRCRIVDMHLKILAKKHVECRFVKMDIRVIPTIGLVKDNKTRDFVVGFTELGNRDDFSTEML